MIAQTVRRVGDPNVVSWNQVGICLRRLEALRQEFSADANLSRYARSKHIGVTEDRSAPHTAALV